jgi:hypothetical protein
MSELVIERRYRGPPDSGNGGYVCGRFAATVKQDMRVRLVSPPPLEVPLVIQPDGESGWVLRHEDKVVATAQPMRLQLEVPPPPRYTQAVWASQHYPGFHQHTFPECFVCGPLRRRGDGLRIFPGQLDTGIVAAPWLPSDSLDAEDGKVAPEFLWAALDCPGYFAVSSGRRPMLLGEMQAHIDRLVHTGEPCTVIGWKVSSEGRKHQAGTAIFDEDGELCARALATWIEMKPASVARAGEKDA